MGNSRKKLVALLLFIVILATVNTHAESNENPHNKMKCNDCHSNRVSFNQPVEKLEFVGKNIVTLCLKCHEDIIYVHHPQRVQVTEDVPDYLPVGEGNSITCRTCHDVHLEDTSMQLLRFSNIGNYTSRIDICYECHKDNFRKLSPHVSEQKGLSCLICHRDAPTIKDTRTTVTLVNKNVEKICNFCHIVDMTDHPLNVDKSISISEELPLSSEGKVVCITCHDPHGTINTINFLRGKYVIDLEFGKYENPHNVKEYFNCLKCHVDIPSVENYVDCRYKDDFILLCYNCHGADAEKCHPINISLSEGMKLPKGFELNDDGLISCVTCHNPDCSEENKKIRYKNLSSLTKSKCGDCHDPDELEDVDPHTGSKELSKNCYYCHKKSGNMDEFGMSQKFVCLKCHSYKEHPPRDSVANFNYSLTSQRIGILLDKKDKITCATCHDPHEKSVENYKLRVVEGMTICEACHQS